MRQSACWLNLDGVGARCASGPGSVIINSCLGLGDPLTTPQTVLSINSHREEWGHTPTKFTIITQTLNRFVLWWVQTISAPEYDRKWSANYPNQGGLQKIDIWCGKLCATTTNKVCPGMPRAHSHTLSCRMEYVGFHVVRGCSEIWSKPILRNIWGGPKNILDVFWRGVYSPEKTKALIPGGEGPAGKKHWGFSWTCNGRQIRVPHKLNELASIGTWWCPLLVKGVYCIVPTIAHMRQKQAATIRVDTTLHPTERVVRHQKEHTGLYCTVQIVRHTWSQLCASSVSHECSSQRGPCKCLDWCVPTEINLMLFSPYWKPMSDWHYGHKHLKHPWSHPSSQFLFNTELQLSWQHSNICTLFTTWLHSFY